MHSGAIASTIAHDSHNLLVVGVDDRDMAFSSNRIQKIGGGMILVNEGTVKAELPLPIAELMSEKNAEEVKKEQERIEGEWKRISYKSGNPFYPLSLLSLPVLPEIRITPRGLIDTLNSTKVPLLV
jgi:adenine deaminase